MRGPEVLVVMMVLAIPLIAVVSKSEIGQAIADAIRHNSGADKGASARQELEHMRIEIDQLRVDLDDLHGQLLESNERLDFAERMLLKSPEHGRMAGPQ